VPNLVVWHHRRAGFWGHLKQVGGYGLHRGYFAHRYPETSFRLKYFVPSSFTAFVVLTLFTQSLPWPLSAIITTAWVIYISVLLIGLKEIAKHETWKVGLATLFYVPPTHFYYGIQFVRGYFKKGKLVSKLR
jgi:hypothetical protein